MTFMRKSRFVLYLLFACLVGGCNSRITSALDTADLRQPVVCEIILLHDNDNHFDFNSSGAFTEKVNEFREKYDNVFLLNAGDILVRNPLFWEEGGIDFYAERGRFMVDAMNEIGYDAMTLGNHELDYKDYVTRDILRSAQFPLLGANVQLSVDNIDKPLPYVVFETVEGYTIAVLGLTTGQAQGVQTTSASATVRDYLYLRGQHNVLAALTHIGYANDKKLAEEFNEIDVIIGGHTHTLLNPAEIVNGVLIAQAGGHFHQINPDYPKFLGVVRIILEDGILVSKTGKVLVFQPDVP